MKCEIEINMKGASNKWKQIMMYIIKYIIMNLKIM